MFPLVTVLIPAYNAELTIRRAIDSALAQDYPNFEILVVDDGSLDATSEIVKDYRRPEIRLHRLPKNRGEGGVLNEGIPIAKGAYIAFLDADDEWLPSKLARQISLLESNPKAIMATCGCRFVDAQGNIFEEFGLKPPPTVAKDQIWRSLLRAAGIAKPCVVARTSAFKQVGLFDTTVPVAADQDMWIRLAMAGEVEYVEDYLTIAHDTPGSLTKTYVKNVDKYILPMTRRHIRSRADLTDREVREILGERYTWVGRTLYLNGTPIKGALLLCRAIVLGTDRVQNLWYLVTASPPARLAKKLVLGLTSAEISARAPRRRPAPTAAILAPKPETLVKIPSGPPILIVTIDTEAEFDWNMPRKRDDVNVQNVRKQISLQKMFDKYGVRPIYLADYAAASQADGYEPLRDVGASGKCEIGAHLQSWETPPFAEELGDHTSFNQNLPGWLQKEKLLRLTEAIVSNIGVQPTAYRGGRYGIGEEIAWILDALGYRIDLSVLPGMDLRRNHGPDFRRTFSQPYWFGCEQHLLEIPLTSGFSGLLSRSNKISSAFYGFASRPGLLNMHFPGFLARMGLFERIPLTPEGISLEELKRLTRVLFRRGQRIFIFSYHSSSLIPGNTPYVRSRTELDEFIARIEAYFDFFFDFTRGVSMTPNEFRTFVLRQKSLVHEDARAVASVV